MLLLPRLPRALLLAAAAATLALALAPCGAAAWDANSLEVMDQYASAPCSPCSENAAAAAAAAASLSASPDREHGAHEAHNAASASSPDFDPGSLSARNPDAVPAVPRAGAVRDAQTDAEGDDKSCRAVECKGECKPKDRDMGFWAKIKCYDCIGHCLKRRQMQ